MCWISNKPPKRLRADADIPICKIMINRGDYIESLYFSKVYELNTLYTEIIGTPKRDGPFGNSINRGFHSYEPETYIDVCTPGHVYIKNIYGNILAGVGTYNIKLIKVNGIIPKGAYYYVNEDGEYVSNKILLTNVLE